MQAENGKKNPNILIESVWKLVIVAIPCCPPLSRGSERVWSGLSQLHYPWSTRWVVPGLESQHSRLGSVAVGSAHLTIAGLNVDVAVFEFLIKCSNH